MAVTLESLRGRIGDVDAHEFMPADRFPEYFGEVGERFLKENQGFWKALNMVPDGHPHKITTKGIVDNVAINDETVWEKKGIWAPGHADMDRRVEVMNHMGVRTELVFPGFGLLAMIQALGGGQGGSPLATKEEIELGREAVKAHNKWAGSVTRKHPDRLRIVGMISSGDPDLTPESLAKRAEEIIKLGVKAIQISAGEPPAGLSPADPKLDAFYAAFAESGTVLTFHPPSGIGFRKTEIWEAALRPEFLGLTVSFHQPMENFVNMMVLGGVFERHPKLRLACIETGGSWIGPLADFMDHGGISGVPPKLPMKPSEYIVRNVRFSVLLSEPVESWIERYPFLQDVYCWSSDYPHIEGQPRSLDASFKRVSRFGDDFVEKFFVTNSRLIFD